MTHPATTKSALRTPQQTRRAYRPNYARYEALKQSWVALHPESTPEQYQVAMREIAGKCGI